MPERTDSSRESRAERHLVLQRRLQQARADPRGLSEAAEFYVALISVLIDTETAIELPHLDDQAKKEKLSRGQPLLFGESLGIDAEAFQALLVRLCVVAEQAAHPRAEAAARRFPWSRSKGDELSDLRNKVFEGDAAYLRAAAAARIREAVTTGAIDVESLLEHVSLGHGDQFTAVAAPAQLDPDLLGTLARLAMRPTMLTYAAASKEAVAQHEESWMRGACPVCGGPPLLSEYHDHDQSRRLRCATCGSAWLFRRMECPHCGTDRFRDLSHFTLDDNLRYRVDVCSVCRHYIKGMMATDPTPSDLLPLEDLLTLYLDAAAQGRGLLPAGR